MKNKKWIFLLVLFNLTNAFADTTYFLPGMAGGEFSEKLTSDLEEDQEDQVFFVPGALKKEMMEKDEGAIFWAVPHVGDSKLDESLNKKDIPADDHFIMGPQKGVYYEQIKRKKKSALQFDQIPQGSGDAQTDKYIESNIFERLDQNRNKGTTAFTLTFFYDGNSYADAGGIYDQTFGGEGAQWYNNAWAILSSEFYLYKSFFNFALGGNIGAGYKTGNGKFSGGERESETKFSLVIIPLDFSVIVEFNLWDWVRLELYAGPSVMGLIQGRDDRESGEEDKSIGQISWGYFGGTRFKLSLGQIFPESNKSMFQTSDVTNYFVTFDIRYQSYSNFKEDDIQVSGISGGLGLAFEFL